MEHGATTLAQGLIAAWSLVGLAVFALLAVAYIAIRSRTRRLDSAEAALAFRSLDIEAFRNLVDSAEEAFLRDHLPPNKFREIQRKRAWAAFIYSWEAGKAAAALARVGNAAQRSADPEIAASGVQVAESALRLRLQSLGACCYLLTEIAFPDLHVRSVPLLVDQYEHTAETLFRLARFSAGGQRLVPPKSI